MGFHLELKNRKIRLIRVPEVGDFYSVAVVDGRTWFDGMMDGEPVLVGIGEGDRDVGRRVPAQQG